MKKLLTAITAALLILGSAGTAGATRYPNDPDREIVYKTISFPAGWGLQVNCDYRAEMARFDGVGQDGYMSWRASTVDHGGSPPQGCHIGNASVSNTYWMVGVLQVFNGANGAGIWTSYPGHVSAGVGFTTHDAAPAHRGHEMRVLITVCSTNAPCSYPYVAITS